jgi:hypothetical protein
MGLHRRGEDPRLGSKAGSVRAEKYRRNLPNVPMPGLLWLQCDGDDDDAMLQCRPKLRRRQPAWDDHVGSEHNPNSQRDLPRMNAPMPFEPPFHSSRLARSIPVGFLLTAA